MVGGSRDMEALELEGEGEAAPCGDAMRTDNPCTRMNGRGPEGAVCGLCGRLLQTHGLGGAARPA